MHWVLLAALPGLLWDGGPETVEALKRAAIECVYVPAEKAALWAAASFCHQPANLSGRQKLAAPGVRWEINVASATRSPWVDSNGWRFLRPGSRTYYYDLPPGASAPLAAAEAFAYDADAWLHIDPQDLEAYSRMLAFLKPIEKPPLPGMANIAVVDDGSDLVGEVLNLLARQNLLCRPVTAPDPRYDLNVQIGAKEYPKSEAANPFEFAQKLRRRLGDDKRSLRIYGSEVVLGRLTGDASRLRLHLLNYGGEKVEGLRIRIRGTYQKGTIAAFGYDSAALEDFAVRDGATEFSILEMGLYAVVDLPAR